MRSLRIRVLAVLAVLGVLAPFLANDVPVLARVSGELRSPVIERWFGFSKPPQDAPTWTDWWIRLADDSPDFAVMPLWHRGPHETHRGRVLATPSLEHPLGVDDVGRDQLARVLHGLFVVTSVALGTAFIALVVGLLFGGIAALSGGIVDAFALRILELFAGLPALLAALACSAFFGGSLLAVVLFLGAVEWPPVARVVRGEILRVRELPMTRALFGFEVPRLRILWRHVWPQVRGPVGVTVAFVAADAVQSEAGLAFLGFTAGSRSVSLGAMIDTGRLHVMDGAWHMWLLPAAILMAVIMGLHAFGDRAAHERWRRITTTQHAGR